MTKINGRFPADQSCIRRAYIDGEQACRLYGFRRRPGAAPRNRSLRAGHVLGRTAARRQLHLQVHHRHKQPLYPAFDLTIVPNGRVDTGIRAGHGDRQPMDGGGGA